MIHASTCICRRCLLVANGAAWQASSAAKPATPEVIAGLLLREMPATAALRELVRIIRWVRLAEEAEQEIEGQQVAAELGIDIPKWAEEIRAKVDVAARRSQLRLVVGGKDLEVES